MTTPLELTDEQIVQFLRSRAADAPTGLLDDVVDQARAASQARRWFGLTPEPMPAHGVSGRTLAILFAATALLVLSLTGALVIGSGLLDPTPDLPDSLGGWTGPVREERGDFTVLPMNAQANEDRVFWVEPDGPDVAIDWVDIFAVNLDRGREPNWAFQFANSRPLGADSDPATFAQGVVLETTGDAEADYVIGIETAASQRGPYRVWVTDLATGESEEQVGPQYGFPVEFRDIVSGVNLWFLPGTAPPGLVADTTRFYAWASATADGEVVAWDYAPDTAWLAIPRDVESSPSASGGAEASFPPAEGVVHGWPSTSDNAPGLYSWNGHTCAERQCTMGFMHNGYGSGTLEITIERVAGGATNGAAEAVTVAGHEGTYERISERTEQWTVAIAGTTIAIRLQAAGASPAELAEAHAIIDSMRTVAWNGNLGFQLVFTLTTDDWDSG